MATNQEGFESGSGFSDEIIVFSKTGSANLNAEKICVIIKLRDKGSLIIYDKLFV